MAVVDPKRMKTVHVIGDSHALGFKSRSIILPEYGFVVTPSVGFVRGLEADKLVQGQQLHPGIVEYFLQQNIIAKDGVMASATADARTIGEQYSGGTGFQRPLVLFIAGEIYLRKYVAAAYAQPNFKMSDAHEKLEQIVRKYITDIRSIQDSFGVFSVVHEVCPPTADDDAFERVNNFRCPREFRAMIYRIFNSHLLDLTGKMRVAFCRSADYLDVQGCLAAEYEFDGVHADPKFVYTSLERTVSRWLHTRASEKSGRYLQWCDQSGLINRRPPLSLRGVSGTMHPFTPEQIAALRAMASDFGPPLCEKPAFDWGTLPVSKEFRTYNGYLSYGVVPPAGLKILHDVLIKGPAGDAFRALLGANFSIVNVRPVHSVPHGDDGVGQQSLHRDGTPPGLYRGIIYLIDVDEGTGPFSYKPNDAAPDIVRVTGKAGATFIFDANAVLHQGSPPRERERWALDLNILVHPRECTEIVHSRPGVTWPVDPYMFEVSNNCYPPLPGNRWYYPALVLPRDPTKAVKTLSAAEMAPAKMAG